MWSDLVPSLSYSSSGLSLLIMLCCLFVSCVVFFGVGVSIALLMVSSSAQFGMFGKPFICLLGGCWGSSHCHGLSCPLDLVVLGPASWLSCCLRLCFFCSFCPVMYIVSVVGVGGYMFSCVDCITFSALYKDEFFDDVFDCVVGYCCCRGGCCCKSPNLRC